jgi:hypothetical protein
MRSSVLSVVNYEGEEIMNRWRGFVLGALGGIAGVVAMHYYWKAAASLAGGDPRKKEKGNDQPGPLDDELAMPLLGLTDGPTAYPAELHAHGLAAHLAYGAATALATQLLLRVLRREG